MFVSIYSIGLLILAILSIKVSLEIKKPKWYWPLVILERPLLFVGLGFIAFRMDNSMVRSAWIYIAWFLFAAFLAESYFDVLTFDPKQHRLSDEIESKGQEIFSLCFGTILTVICVFPAYAMNLAWAYNKM